MSRADRVDDAKLAREMGTSAFAKPKNAPCWPHQCPLRDDWKGWSAEKRADRLFQCCPYCKTFGCHVEANR